MLTALQQERGVDRHPSSGGQRAPRLP
jgi:hypothetical protein